MANYSYKYLRELIPQHIEDKYKEESGMGGKWYWDNEYNGNLFAAGADYIIELEKKLIDAGLMEYDEKKYDYNKMEMREKINGKKS